MMPTEHDREMARLHTRAVRGETLSTDEQAALHAWYATQDAVEAATLHIPTAAPLDLAALQADIDAAMARLDRSTQYVQELAQQNASLRQQIALLERRLRERVPSAA